MAWHPGASRAQTFTKGGSYTRQPAIIVLHTTEGVSWPGYGGGASAPHFTLKPNGDLRQHYDTARPARALVNRSGGVQTNNAGAIQVELVGTSGWADHQKGYPECFNWPEADDEALGHLAALLAWISRTHGIPLVVWRAFPRWQNRDAMPMSTWRTFRGICGHSQVPENTHSDPGALPMSRIIKMALGQSVGAGGGTSVPTTGGPAVTPSGKLVVDGRYGKATHSEVQRRLGRPVDGRLGEGDLAALCDLLGLPTYSVISDQPRTAEQIGNAIVPKIWDHDPDHAGPRSKIVRRLEAYSGATVDRGAWGPDLSTHIQQMLNAHPGFMTLADKGIVQQRVAKHGA